MMLVLPVGQYSMVTRVANGSVQKCCQWVSTLMLPVLLVGQWWQVDKVNPIKLFDDNRSVGGFQLRRLLFRQGQHAYVRRVVETLIDLYGQGKIRPVIDSIWAFEDVSSVVI